MNILPKKRWHVRTKENIARVRKDEAEAREQEEKRQKQQEFAESEARINFLRKQSGLPERQSSETTTAVDNASNDKQEHVDLFADYKTHIKTTNKDLEKEKKDEQEKYEKQIGYLTYLGQDTNEALKLRSWYEVAPKRQQVESAQVVEKDLKIKHSHDPLTLINALLPPEKPATSTRKRKRSLSPVTADVPVETESSTTKSKHPEKSHKTKKSKKEKKHKKDKDKVKKHKKKKHRKSEKVKAEKKAQEAAEELRKKQKLTELRKERLRREAVERKRQEALLAPPKANDGANANDPKVAPTPRIVQKYNSQFNPELAKQNML